MRKLVVAATQMSCSQEVETNIARAEKLVRKAAAQGAQVILLQELFASLYFCQVEDPAFYQMAREVEEHQMLRHFQTLARELEVVLPVSFFEKKNNARYNSVAVYDAGGELLGVYRKSHIPDGPGYEEKFYFNPGDTGFKVWDTRYARIGVGICWDQWFPEAARCMVLQGAELLLYPTAIGSEPQDAGYDSKEHWQICMRGHAAANLVPVIASNRIGVERFGCSEINFYGSSFITNQRGELVREADRTSETVLVAEFDLDELEKQRAAWGVFRDRRPELYGPLLTNDGCL
jgi:N-carbamoylputrescine amidase